MMKLLGFLLLLVPALANPQMAARLEAMKKDFPTHVVWPVTDRSDPAIVQCYRRHLRMMQQLSAHNLAADLQRWKDEVAQEIREIEWRLQDPRTRVKSSTRFAEEKNLSWLKQKVTPYLRRLEQMQRGR